MSYFSPSTAARENLRIATADILHWLPNFALSGAWTIMGWFKATTDTDAHTSLLCITDGVDSGDVVYGGMDSNGTLIRLWNNASGTNGTENIVIDEWFHMAMTYGGPSLGVQALYLNGTFSHEHGSAVSGSSIDYIHWGGFEAFEQSIDGLVAECKFWPVALDSAETIRAEMWAKGPLNYPRQCIYFPCDSKHQTSDGQGNGLQLENVGMTFDDEQPPGLLPASFFPRQFIHNVPSVSVDSPLGTHVYQGLLPGITAGQTHFFPFRRRGSRVRVAL